MYAYLTIFVIMILLPNAYLNKEMMWQIKRLLKIKQVYQRLIRDDNLLRANPVTIKSRIQ